MLREKKILRETLKTSVSSGTAKFPKISKTLSTFVASHVRVKKEKGNPRDRITEMVKGGGGEGQDGCRFSFVVSDCDWRSRGRAEYLREAVGGSARPARESNFYRDYTNFIVCPRPPLPSPPRLPPRPLHLARCSRQAPGGFTRSASRRSSFSSPNHKTYNPLS